VDPTLWALGSALLSQFRTVLGQRSFPGEACAQIGFLESGLEVREGVVQAAESAQVCAGGEAKQVGSGEGRAEGQPFGGLVESPAQAQVNR